MIRRAAVALMGLALAATAESQVQLPAQVQVPAPVQQIVQPVVNTIQPIVQPVVNTVEPVVPPIVQPTVQQLQTTASPFVQFPTGSASGGASAPSSPAPARPAPEQYQVPFSSAAGGSAGGFPQMGAGGGVGPMTTRIAQRRPAASSSCASRWRRR